MTVERDELLKFINNDSDQNFNFPVIFTTRSLSRNSKHDALRRNVSIQSSQYRKSDARLVNKRGRTKLYFKKIPHKSIKFARDLWNTLVMMQWRWLLLVVALVNLVAYLCCGILFYYDSWFSGDFDNSSDHLVCIEGVNKISNFFMLGIETMTTTGYGYMHPTENCSLFYVVLTFSTLTSIFIDGMFISVVYAKLNRIKDQNVYGKIFSRKAVIAMRNGSLCLIVRVNDREGKHWITSDIRMYLIKESVSEEDVIDKHFVTELETQPYGMLFWPIDVVHEINCKSPLWQVSARDLMTNKLEIVVVVSGSSVKTGQSTKSQTSYLNKEIMWGYRFAPCLEHNAAKKEYVVNKRLFNTTVPQEVPLCSAKVLDSLQKHINERRSLNVDLLNGQTDCGRNLLKTNEI
ncbi:inward rectifier potassium channel 2-like [Sitophilus oryzae]|uniref:Inward rectifier potassium channel 2-like n=1 Tax=Sitophilus oryzae TaxID=7048 RepID=A0A6J2YVI8_SITOR|nr:inward rectifier potassium channel 2-like [Sitophilus oryzae]